MTYVFQDWRINRGQFRSQVVLAMFRFGSVIAKRPRSVLWYVGVPYLVFYRLLVEYLLGIELKPTTVVGARLRLDHGIGLVVNRYAVIGAEVHLRHCTTIGCAMTEDGGEGPSPVIEDRVEIGSNSVILGAIRLGAGCKIGAGSVVLSDVPAGKIAIGNPARIVAARSDDDTSLPDSGRV